MDFSENDAISLAAKLEAMDLTEGEGMALDAVFDAARSDEVAGFARHDIAMNAYLEPLGGLIGKPLGMRDPKHRPSSGLYEEVSFKP